MAIALLLLLIVGQAAALPGRMLMESHAMDEHGSGSDGSGSGGSGSGVFDGEGEEVCRTDAQCPKGSHCHPNHSMAGANGCMLDHDMHSSPPPPAFPPPAIVVQLELTAAGVVEDYDPASSNYTTTVTKVAEAAAVSEDSVVLEVSAGSVNIKADVTTYSTAAAETVNANLAAAFSTAEAAEALLGYTVLAAPTVTTVYYIHDDDDDTPLVVGLSVGLVLGIPLVLIVGYFIFKRQQTKGVPLVV